MRMTHPRRLMVAVLALFSMLTLAACTPEEVAIWRSLGPDPVTAETMTEPQRKIIAAVQDQQLRYLAGVHAAQQEQARLSTDCRAAMRSVWPSHLHGWADRIMYRESRYIHTAANRSSSARGCFQLLLSLHSHRYYAVGCTPNDWSNAVCNVKAAWHLYTAPGGGPGHWDY